MGNQLDPRWFKPLLDVDIEEKIQANIVDWKIDLPELRNRINKELFQTERLRLYNKAKNEQKGFLGMFDRKFFHTDINLEIQIQNLKEQISYIDKKLGEKNG